MSAVSVAQAGGTGKPWVADFVLLSALWGASFLFMRVIAVEIGPLPTAGLRVGLAALFLLPLDAAGAPLPIDYIVSGLPLLSIPLPVRQRIVQAGALMLAPQGRLVQFTYALRGPSPWQIGGLARLHSERVIAILPPARVDVLGHAAVG